jgi:mycothiol synthase
MLGILREADRQGRMRFAWRREGRGILAAAVVLASPGRVGFVYHSPPDADGVDPDALTDILPSLCRYALVDDGLLVVQTMIEPDKETPRRLVESAGMTRIARLIYMHCNLDDAPDPPKEGPAPWSFQQASALTDQQLGRLIRRTYRGSLDCPALRGKRPMQDVLASHRATGRYWPGGWWVARDKTEPVGCILLNRSAVSPAAELVYMGVVREHRGCGLGRVLLLHAADQARQAGLETLQLAVDADNAPAENLYERFGFRERSRKDCFALFA